MEKESLIFSVMKVSISNQDQWHIFEVYRLLYFSVILNQNWKEMEEKFFYLE